MVMSKGCSHFVHGNLDCWQSQLAVSASRIVGLSKGLIKAGEEFGTVGGLKIFEEGIISNIDGL